MWDSTEIVTALAVAATTWCASGSIASADVHLAIQDRRVSLMAKDATLRQILMECSTVGHTTIVNAELVPGEPITLHLTNVLEGLRCGSRKFEPPAIPRAPET